MHGIRKRRHLRLVKLQASCAQKQRNSLRLNDAGWNDLFDPSSCISVWPWENAVKGDSRETHAPRPRLEAKAGAPYCTKASGEDLTGRLELRIRQKRFALKALQSSCSSSEASVPASRARYLCFVPFHRLLMIRSTKIDCPKYSAPSFPRPEHVETAHRGLGWLAIGRPNGLLHPQ
jgi:hypothetical protein